MKSSLRLKITLSFLAFFAVVYVGVLAAAWMFHRGSIIRAMDRHMVALADGLGERIFEFGEVASLTSPAMQPLDPNASVLAVRAENGQFLGVSAGIDTLSLPPLPTTNIDVVFHDLDENQAFRLTGRPGQLRLASRRCRVPSGEVYYVDVAGLIWTEAVDVNARTLIMAAVAALVASALAAWLLAGRAVSPLEILTQTVSQLGFKSRELPDPKSSSPEVERLQSELGEAMKRIEEGYRNRERFLDNVAHDLKTPLGVMLAESQLLRPRTASVQEIERFQQSVIEELWRLTHLVQGILALAGADEGKALARRTTVSINDVVIESIVLCKRQADAARVTLEPVLIDPEGAGAYAELEGDEDLLVVMLVNIVRNAIRFSPAGQVVHIETRMTDDKLLIRIRDHGPGIPEEYVEKVFDRFIQVPATSHHFSGAGIGLAIAKSVASSHDAAIWARNCEGGGCEFTVAFPLASVASSSPSA